MPSCGERSEPARWRHRLQDGREQDQQDADQQCERQQVRVHGNYWTSPTRRLTSSDMMKSETFTVRLEPEAKAALERMAAIEGRTLSDVARRIIADWLKRRQPRAK